MTIEIEWCDYDVVVASSLLMAYLSKLGFRRRGGPAVAARVAARRGRLLPETQARFRAGS